LSGRARRRALRLAVATLLVSGAAWSHGTGQSGYSGKKAGTTCAQCHGGGPTPSVSFEGPTTIEAGTIVPYTFHVETTQPLAGMNVAADDGVKLHDDDGGTTFLSISEELVQPRPLATDAGDGGEAVFSFSVEAPAYGGPIELWGAGNAVDGDHTSAGDGSQTATLNIMVDGPPRPEPDADVPPPTPPSRPPAGPGSPDASSDAAPAGDADDAAGPSGDDGGCAVAFGGAPALPGGAALLLGVLGVLATTRVFGRRRRRR
jgi:hypothetical protein